MTILTITVIINLCCNLLYLKERCQGSGKISAPLSTVHDYKPTFKSLCNSPMTLVISLLNKMVVNYYDIGFTSIAQPFTLKLHIGEGRLGPC